MQPRSNTGLEDLEALLADLTDEFENGRENVNFNVNNAVLDLSSQNLNFYKSTVKAIVDFLKCHPEITELNLMGNDVSVDGAKQLGKMALMLSRNNIKLAKLNLGFNNLTDDLMKRLLPLAYSNHIGYLCLDINHISHAFIGEHLTLCRHKVSVLLNNDQTDRSVAQPLPSLLLLSLYQLIKSSSADIALISWVAKSISPKRLNDALSKRKYMIKAADKSHEPPSLLQITLFKVKCNADLMRKAINLLPEDLKEKLRHRG